MPDDDCFTFAEDGGMIQFLADLGDTVAKGQAIARIFPVARTGIAPITLTARRSGLFTARHFPGLVKPGDCVAVIAEVIAEEGGA
jgi:N-alpha-acetyl-L-2,4-diaminobutyrate deacetylase